MVKTIKTPIKTESKTLYESLLIHLDFNTCSITTQIKTACIKTTTALSHPGLNPGRNWLFGKNTTKDRKAAVIMPVRKFYTPK